MSYILSIFTHCHIFSLFISPQFLISVWTYYIIKYQWKLQTVASQLNSFRPHSNRWPINFHLQSLTDRHSYLIDRPSSDFNLTHINTVVRPIKSGSTHQIWLVTSTLVRPINSGPTDQLWFDRSTLHLTDQHFAWPLNSSLDRSTLRLTAQLFTWPINISLDRSTLHDRSTLRLTAQLYTWPFNTSLDRSTLHLTDQHFAWLLNSSLDRSTLAWPLNSHLAIHDGTPKAKYLSLIHISEPTRPY